MTALLVVVLLTALASLALGVAGRRRIGRTWLVAEVAMVAAMLDVHVPALHLVPAPLWSLLLAGCAVTAALVDRIRRSRGTARRHATDALHGVGMLLAAGLVLLSAAPVASPHAHGHSSLALPLALGVAAYSVVAARTALAVRTDRLDTARRLASLAGIVAMGAMSVA
ncbi:hypothetical protein [Rathayibacter sp. SD072]|uniref:hypothetical protein n=1 Tax=Rathayibacter sp. SD072 TaxID=2781731 RepID=UPI001A959B91|nr:hypothetical protein [Rathayibacter sp. SD072]MBO0983563.1 hypothetical protein [Rathayibacter sp. SD072]